MKVIYDDCHVAGCGSCQRVTIVATSTPCGKDPQDVTVVLERAQAEKLCELIPVALKHKVTISA